MLLGESCLTFPHVFGVGAELCIKIVQMSQTRRS